jgi:predicted PurR-regulated permease PerM
MSVIVCGNIFGVVGLLIAIPLAAIVDYIYKEGIVVLLEKRKSEHT